MRLFQRRTDTNAIPEDLQPYYEGQPSGWRRWVAPILRIGLLVLLLVLLVWGGIALVQRLTGRNNEAANNGNTNQSQQANKPAQSSDSPNKNQNKSTTGSNNQSTTQNKQTPAPAPAQTPAPARTPSPAPASTPTPTPAPSPSAGSQTLVNTGPGEVAALFGAAVAAGTLFHRYVIVRVRSRS